MIVKTVSIKSVAAPGMGTLSFFEAEKDIPFAIKRIYYIHGVPKGVQRGGHAHRKLRQILWCPYGSILIKLDDGADTAAILLDDPTKGLLVESNTWRDMIWQQDDSVLCVVADGYYDADDYIRDYDQFLLSVGHAAKCVAIKLRPLAAKDAPLMLEWMHDAELTAKMAVDFSKKTLADCERFIQASRQESRDLHLAIADETDTYIGTVSLKNIDFAQKQAEFAIAIRRSALHKGYSRYGMEQMLRYGFETLQLERIYWCVAKDNLRAVKFYDKEGYRQTTACPEARQRPDLLWYEVRNGHDREQKTE